MERTPDARYRRKRRIWRWLILVLLIAVGVTGYTLWRRPHVRVTAYVAGEIIYMVRDPGVLTLKSPSHFTLRRWADGKPLWQVHAARPVGGSSPGAWSLPAWGNYSHGVSTFALSPSGEILATASVQPHGVRLQTWKQGTLRGDTTLSVKMPPPGLPYALYPYFSLSVDNNGRAFFLQREAKLTVLEAGGIVAERSMPFYTTLSEDGRFASQFYARTGKTEIVAVRVDARKIELTSIGTGEPFILFPNGNVMTYNGDLYAATGKVAYPRLPGYYPVGFLHPCVTMVREWICMFNDPSGPVAVCNPDTGDAWYLPPIARLPVDVSMDGRYVLTGIHRQWSSSLQPVMKSLELFFPDLMEQRPRWAIYQRPGTLRITIPKTVNSPAGRLLVEYAVALSPDGRSFISYVSLPGGLPPPGGPQYTIAFCRW